MSSVYGTASAAAAVEEPPIGAKSPRAGQRFRAFLHSAQMVRIAVASLLCLVMLGLVAIAVPARAETHFSQNPQFRAFVAGLWPQAARAGVSRKTFDAAFNGLEPSDDVLSHTQKQPEFAKPIGDYLATAVSEKRVDAGLGKAHDFDHLLAEIERRYGVDRYVVLGVWGMETSFGTHTGDVPVIQALATLAFARYRGDYFRRELIIALKILDQGNVPLSAMTGSWAGAMGQTQFMPTSFMKYAVDFEGNGRRNIWTSVPDALASTANYLAKHGWIRNYTWGYEVVLPPGFDASSTGRSANFSTWARNGITRADGQPMPTIGDASLVMPAGQDGPTFLVTRNFKVIRSYNDSLAYALGVSLLSDRVAGAGPLKTEWPVATAAR